MQSAFQIEHGTPPSEPALYQLTSKKLSDYTTVRMDSTIVINLDSEALRRAATIALDVLSKESGIKPSTFDPRNSSQLDKLYLGWLNHVVPLFESKSDYYDEAREQLSMEHFGYIGLGEALLAQAAVCRELTIFAHILFAEFGVSTTVNSGEIFAGGHAWLRLPDGRLLDSNYIRAVVQPDEYERRVTAYHVSKEIKLVKPRG